MVSLESYIHYVLQGMVINATSINISIKHGAQIYLWGQLQITDKHVDIRMYRVYLTMHRWIQGSEAIPLDGTILQFTGYFGVKCLVCAPLVKPNKCIGSPHFRSVDLPLPWVRLLLHGLKYTPCNSPTPRLNTIKVFRSPYIFH